MNIPQRFWTMAVTALTLLVVFLAALSIKTLKEVGYVGSNPNQSNIINVEGTGEAVAVPDIATFSFSVTENAKTVADAQTKATTKINAALKALRDAGIADKDIQTQGYNINPHYEYQNAICPTSAPAAVGMMVTPVYCPSGKSVLTGYDVSQTIGVKVRDLSKAGAIFTSVGSLGVTNVNSLSFDVDQPDAVQAKARAEAIAKAQAKADELARQLGVHIVRVVSFSESGGYRPYAYGMGGASMMVKAEASDAAPAPEVPTGEQKTTVSVNISYEIR